MNKMLALALIMIFLVSCTKIDLAKDKVVTKIVETTEKVEEKADNFTRSNEYVKKATEKTEEIIKIDEKYETPEVIINKIDDEIEIESFGEVI